MKKKTKKPDLDVLVYALEQVRPIVPELPDACYVKNVKGKQLVFMPDGTIIPKVVWTRLYDGSKKEDLSYVIVKLLVNLK